MEEHSALEYQPGSNDRVLANRLGIAVESDIQRIESVALARSMLRTLNIFEDTLPITVSLIIELHKDWLGHIYDVAGQVRKVNMSKPGIVFCAACYIPVNLRSSESSYLRPLTPCARLGLEDVCDRAAKVHAELLLIHPFREGNGCLARWIADMMILQAGFPAPLYDVIGEHAEARRAGYFAALRKGFFDQDT